MLTVKNTIRNILHFINHIEWSIHRRLEADMYGEMLHEYRCQVTRIECCTTPEELQDMTAPIYQDFNQYRHVRGFDALKSQIVNRIDNKLSELIDKDVDFIQLIHA